MKSNGEKRDQKDLSLKNMAKTDEKRQRTVNHSSMIDSAVLNQVSEKLDRNKRSDA